MTELVDALVWWRSGNSSSASSWSSTLPPIGALVVECCDCECGLDARRRWTAPMGAVEVSLGPCGICWQRCALSIATK